MWKEKTRQDSASSTLPNRYNRLKNNMMIHYKQREVSAHTKYSLHSANLGRQRLLDAEAMIEEDYRWVSQWRLIAETMARAGPSIYLKASIQMAFGALTAERAKHPSGRSKAERNFKNAYEKLSKGRPQKRDINTDKPTRKLILSDGEGLKAAKKEHGRLCRLPVHAVRGSRPEC